MNCNRIGHLMGSNPALDGLVASSESPPHETFPGTLEGMLKFSQHDSLVTSLPCRGPHLTSSKVWISDFGSWDTLSQPRA